MTKNTTRSSALPELTESWASAAFEDGDESTGSFDLDLQAMSDLSSIHEDAEADEVHFATSSPRRNGVVTARSQELKNGNTLSNRGASSPPTTPLRTSTTSPTTPRSAEPEFIMPRMHRTPWAGKSPSRTSQSTPQLTRRHVNSPRTIGGARGTPSRGQGMPRRPPASRVRQQESQMETGKAWDGVYLLISSFLNYIFGIIHQALHFIRPAVSFLLALWILSTLLILVRNTFTVTIANALSPICHIPGSALMLPFCSYPKPGSKGPLEFNQLVNVQSAFEDVLASSTESANLPLDMKRSEGSIRDLKLVVQFSTLPSRNELVFEFNGFIETARKASADLSRFNSRIGKAVDHILSTNRWTLQVVNDVANREAARGALSRFTSKIFGTFDHPKLTHESLVKQYISHTREVEEQIASLILEAQALLGILQNLDERLDIIASVATRDGITTQGHRDELFAYLWTKLGGNRATVRKLDEHLRLLREMTQYRKTAWAHVSATMIRLQEIAASLEDLRERLGAPEVVGVRHDVPLDFHIENIQLGVDRLEAMRQHAIKVEQDNYRKVLERGERADGRLIESSDSQTIYVNA